MGDKSPKNTQKLKKSADTKKTSHASAPATAQSAAAPAKKGK